MEKEISKFNFTDYRITKSLLCLHPEKGEVSSQLKVTFAIPDNISAEGGHIVYPLNIIICDENGALEIEVGIVGNFVIAEELKDIESFIKINAPAILFPYVRAHVTTLTSISGIKPVILPTLNMTKDR